MATRQLFRDYAVTLLTAFGRAVRAKIEVIPVERYDRLAGFLVQTVSRWLCVKYPGHERELLDHSPVHTRK